MQDGEATSAREEGDKREREIGREEKCKGGGGQEGEREGWRKSERKEGVEWGKGRMEGRRARGGGGGYSDLVPTGVCR